ncbi:MAG: SnoaL-like polyketide cyclase [Polyangiales bacterium]
MTTRKDLLLQGRAAAIAATPDSAWRHGKAPDYGFSDTQMPVQRTSQHAAGSLGAIVEGLVQIFEMEVSNKPDPATWLSVARDHFRMNINGGEVASADLTATHGTYNLLIGESPYYSAKEETFASSHEVFHKTFPGGFLWEVLEVYSPPPVITFKWRHWGVFDGPYKGFAPTGKTLELFGMTLVRVDDELQILDLEHYYDNNTLLQELTGGCPIPHPPKP